MTITHRELDRLLGQRRACKGDSPHSARCKRCRRGHAAAQPITRKKATA